MNEVKGEGSSVPTRSGVMRVQGDIFLISVEKEGKLIWREVEAHTVDTGEHVGRLRVRITRYKPKLLDGEVLFETLDGRMMIVRGLVPRHRSRK